MFLAAAASTVANSPSTSPYVIAACIGAIPALLTATATWYSIHKGNKDNHEDNAGITSSVNVLSEQVSCVVVIGANDVCNYSSVSWEMLSCMFTKNLAARCNYIDTAWTILYKF